MTLLTDLETLTAATTTLYDHILQMGHEPVSAALTKEERELVRKAKGRASFVSPSSFHNARKLVLGDTTNTLVYVEGYLKSTEHPIRHHGWAEINGKVIDLTNRYGREKVFAIGTIPDGAEYLGVNIPKEKLAFTSDEFSPVLDDVQARRV